MIDIDHLASLEEAEQLGTTSSRTPISGPASPLSAPEDLE
ncbi:hypothetical protein M5E82_24725 [Parabacteroides distasonis]|nr:hypothetical protein M5E82_24725 [Parabacteroides distasonis]